jgi:DNA repair photolyase
MKSITRKTLFYKSKVDYGNYAINHAQGCSHGCTYCYEMKGKVQKNKIKNYKSWTEPKIVENTLELLDKEIPKLKEKIKVVHLCFSTDPFMCGQKEVGGMTLKIIERLNKENIKCTVLTKGILPKELAEKIYSRKNEYGITLVSLDPEFQEKFEPGAAPVNERLASLRYLHERGSKTWVSIEPYPTPNIVSQDFLKLLEKVKFVDKIIFGSWNYNRLVSKYPNNKKFYLDCAETLSEFCKKNGIELHVKIKGKEFDRFRNAKIFEK